MKDATIEIALNIMKMFLADENGIAAVKVVLDCVYTQGGLDALKEAEETYNRTAVHRASDL